MIGVILVAIAIKNLLGDKVRLFVSIGGVALSVLLMLSLLGVYYGSLSQARSLPENAGADIWVVQDGSSDLFHTFSLLPNGLEENLYNIEGVKSVSKIINHAIQISINDKKVTSAVIGFDNDKGIGGPWSMYRGSQIIKTGEAVVDRSLASSYKLSIGDSLEIGNKEFQIVGISNQTNALVFQYIFLPYEDAVEVFEQKEVVNYYLLRIDQENKNNIKEDIKKIAPNLNVKLPDEIAENNEKVIEGSFLPIIALVVFIGVIVGAVVMGLTIYSATLEKLKEYAVLKAIGTGDKRLFGIVFEQTLIISALGFITGIIFFFLIKIITFYALPSVSFDIGLPTYLFIFGLIVIISILASSIPIIKISKVDPASVFRA